MSRVVSDAQQTIVRASQLGDVIVNVIKPPITSTAIFIVIGSINITVTITFGTAGLTCVATHTLQDFNDNKSPGLSTSTLFRPDGDATITAGDGSFPALETVPSYDLITTPSQENLLSNVGSFAALDTTPLFDVS